MISTRPSFSSSAIGTAGPRGCCLCDAPTVMQGLGGACTARLTLTAQDIKNRGAGPTWLYVPDGAALLKLYGKPGHSLLAITVKLSRQRCYRRQSTGFKRDLSESGFRELGGVRIGIRERWTGRLALSTSYVFQ